MHTRSGILALLAALAFTSVAAAGPPKVGDAAPEITAGKWFNAPGKVSLKDLRGKVVVLDYWATW